MADFPKLKTGALAQYPLQRRVEYPTTVLRFLDGAEQRWPEQGSASRKWVVRLDLLDEGEISSLAAFFDTQSGRGGHFSFEDPLDGSLHGDCSFEQDKATIEAACEGRWSTELTVRENK